MSAKDLWMRARGSVGGGVAISQLGPFAIVMAILLVVEALHGILEVLQAMHEASGSGVRYR